MSTVLLVEDNPHIMKINEEMLTMRGYEVFKAATLAECLKVFQWHNVDIVVLDILLPDGNGIEACRELKTKYHVPILFLSALGDSRNVVEGLRAGGDDYLAKPYDLEELAARIEARLRGTEEAERYVCYSDLKLDTLTGSGYLFGENMQLTQKEFLALLLLARNAEKPVSAELLLHEVWDSDTESGKNMLWTLLSRIRGKLQSDKSRLEIVSKRGSGYILEKL